ncbi:MAG: VWA domain-containing protein [Porticoccaceae bacterium]
MNPIHNAFPIVASAIGKRANIELVWGQKACTDGTRIELPYFDPQSDRLRRIALGKVLHECGHVRFTDFSLPEGQPLQEKLLNIFEDGRIERCMMREYGGGQKLLQEMAHEVFLGDTKPTAEQMQSETPSAKLLNFVLYQQRSRLPGQEAIQPLAKDYLQLVEDTFPRGAVTKLKGMLTQADDLESTADAWDLAAQVYTMLEAESEEEQEQQENEKSLPGAEDSDENFDSSPSMQAGGEGDADSSQDANSAAKQAALKEALKDQNPQAFDIGQVMADELDEGYREAERTGEGSLGGTAPSSSDDIAESTKDVDAAKAMVNRLRRKLQVALEDAKRNGEFRTRKGRRIDANRLPGIFTGNNRVFRRTEENNLPSASVILLIDRSGSMGEMSYYDPTTGKPVTAIEAARKAALGLALSIDGFTHVELAGMAFPGKSADVLKIQNFGTNARASEGRYGGILAEGGTPLAPALLYAAEQLFSRRNERKIIIVLSDGEPRKPKATQSIIDRCKLSGIELYGLAIKSDALKRYIEDTEYLKDASCLADSLFRLADRILKR